MVLPSLLCPLGPWEGRFLYTLTKIVWNTKHKTHSQGSFPLLALWGAALFMNHLTKPIRFKKKKILKARPIDTEWKHSSDDSFSWLYNWYKLSVENIWIERQNPTFPLPEFINSWWSFQINRHYKDCRRIHGHSYDYDTIPLWSFFYLMFFCLMLGSSSPNPQNWCPLGFFFGLLVIAQCDLGILKVLMTCADRHSQPCPVPFPLPVLGAITFWMQISRCVVGWPPVLSNAS